MRKNAAQFVVKGIEKPTVFMVCALLLAGDVQNRDADQPREERQDDEQMDGGGDGGE